MWFGVVFLVVCYLSWLAFVCYALMLLHLRVTVQIMTDLTSPEIRALRLPKLLTMFPTLLSPSHYRQLSNYRMRLTAWLVVTLVLIVLLALAFYFTFLPTKLII